jgi:transcriptional pleiotropic regulator of transition state genes
MIRKLDNLGRIVLPVELRDILGIKTKDPLEIFVDEKAIILAPYRPGCLFCGQIHDLIEIREKKVCRECVKEANDLGSK